MSVDVGLYDESQSHRVLAFHTYRVAQKTGTLLCALTSSNIGRFSNLFHCLNQEDICNNIVTKDPTTPQVCRYQGC